MELLYQGSTLIGTATSAPYTFVWNDVGTGSYTLTAKATDDKGATKVSAARTVQVTAAQETRLYYLHTDHLNTPRVVTDGQQRIVWRNGPLDEPFGNGVPENDPDGDGELFELNLRFPGQYFDKETNTHYNTYRDHYFPARGRYGQADPIGLEGGINTYSYVNGNPLLYVDPTGEIAFVPIVVGIGAGLAFDYAVSKWKEEHCSCKNTSTPAGAAGNAAVGAANGIFGPYATKPRTGISGGGPAGSSTSVYSQAVTAASQSGAVSAGQRHALRGAGRVISKGLPWVSAALAGYELYDAFNCDD